MILEEKIVQLLKNNGIKASTLMPSKATFPHVLISRLGGDSNYGSRSTWSRTGYRLVTIGFSVTDKDYIGAQYLADRIVDDILESAVLNGGIEGVASGEPSGVSTVPFDNQTICTFSVDFIEEK